MDVSEGRREGGRGREWEEEGEREREILILKFFT